MSSDWWDDFFNNMATDLAPLISLFGEQPTKQFISESTSPLDCFILAMAPLGIITIIISAIRVGGNSSLRAFVGRAQEGIGNIEAELCSSTSRHVCELYNNGGIARVFGRPKILEIVQDLQVPDGDFATIGDTTGDIIEDVLLPKTRVRSRESDQIMSPVSVKSHKSDQIMNPRQHIAGIYPFWDYVKYFERHRDRPREWEEPSYTRKIAGNPDLYQRLCRAFWPSKHVDAEKQDNLVDYQNDQLAPHPNLSLNVGIKKRSPVWFILAAITGLLLQSGVLIYAGLTVSILQETFDKDGKPVDSYAFPITCVGTILVCVGVGMCAHVIERNTTERVFRRTAGGSKDNLSPKKARPPSRLFWIQPGNQVIGDQFFDSFAYGEPSKGFLNEYVSSRKVTQDQKMRRTSMVLVCVSAPIAVLGFIFQFVGLRALHSTVSIAQLGAVVLMSIIRACLRTQRFGAEENLLGHDPDLYQGHELDWLSIELFKDQLIEKVHEESKDQSTKETFIWKIITCPGSQIFDNPRDHSLSSTKIFLSRVRLARMTGSQPGQPRSQTNSIQWDGDLVTGRSIAPKLAKALEDTIAVLLGNPVEERHFHNYNAISVPISCCAVEVSTKKTRRGCIQHRCLNGDRILNEETVWISLVQDKTSQDTWRVDISDIEALLGLWLWSFRNLQRCEEKEDDNWKWRVDGRFGEDLPCTRLLSVWRRGEESPDIPFIKPWLLKQQREIIWAENYVRTNFPSDPEFDSACIWMTYRTHGPHTFYPSNLHEPEQGAVMTQRKWVFGWHLLPPVTPTDSQATSADSTTPQESLKLNALAVPSDQNLAMTCAQEIFILVFKSLLNKVQDIRGKTLERRTRYNIIVANSNITEIVKAFTNSGLGSEGDALACIIPTLHTENKLPIASLALIKSQERELIESLNVKLHTWKMSSFELSEPSSGYEAESKPLQELRLAIIALYELYEASISISQLTSVRNYGIRGFCSLIKRQRDEMLCLLEVPYYYSFNVISTPVDDAGPEYKKVLDEIERVMGVK